MSTRLRAAWLTSSLATIALLTLGSGCIVGFKVESDTAGEMPDKNSSDDQTASGTSSGSTSSGTTSGSDSGGDSDSTSTSGTTTTSTSTTTSSTTIGESTGETSSTTGGPVGECIVDADCQLFSDCCSCQATPVGEDPDKCDAVCDEARCDLLGIDSAVCSFGTCTTSRVKCDDSGVLCDAPPPACPVGLLPQVNDAGDCWTGECVRGIQCESVPSCDACPGNGWTCVSYVALPSTYRCEPLPPACDGAPSCECAGDAYCDPDIFSICAAENDGIQCICPNC